MLNESVIFSGAFLFVTSALLFTVGQTVRVSHFAYSQLIVLGLGAAAWAFQCALTGHALPFAPTMLIVVVAGSIVAAGFRHWSSLAHAGLTAIIFTVASFLIYATYVLFAAKLGPASLAFGIILLLLQAAVLVLLVAHTFEILDVVCRTRWQRIFGAVTVPGYAPKVSLHVPTHNEPPELVIQTLNALARLDYENFEVLVIDNNTRDDDLWRPLEAHCKRLGDRFRFFHLMPWPGFKSGALNFALDQTPPDAEIVGIIDADYVVEPNYLRDLVGHFADPTVGFVQTPQDYRDAAERGRFGRALYLSYQYFFSVSMASRNERNAIIFAGTMGLIRRDALKATGGWDEWCITEDAEVSFRLLKAGYQSVYVPDTYGRGLMPLDYAGLKKQRFRWAFGGMQLLRMHAPVVFGLNRAGTLTLAQRYAYISGGLQWLNDPITFGFTVVLLIASTALIGGGSLYIQPLVGGSVLIPPLLIWFGVMRFLWALRLRCRCTVREAVDAFVVLLGLTWVVTLACARGLIAHEGVFLRTPKKADDPRLIDAARIVWFEGLLATACFTALVILFATHPSQPLSARTVLISMLGWQGILYASAARTSFWNYRAHQVAVPPTSGFAFASLTHPSALTERRLSVLVGFMSFAFAGLFWVAVVFAPTIERVWQSDPLNEFISARTLLPSSPEALVDRQLVLEADAARRQDIDAAIALWDPDGVIRDCAFTPDDSDDDQVWKGVSEIRHRYADEFQLRRYRRLTHVNLAVTFQGEDDATIVNDLDAVIESAHEVAHVRLNKTDRWTLHRRNGQWRIVQLEINRAARAPEPAGPLVAGGRPE
jgi:cellulose synthase/poly-beta-1,6-N-acetylglucosamine synthase-like glycosyltransferase